MRKVPLTNPLILSFVKTFKISTNIKFLSYSQRVFWYERSLPCFMELKHTTCRFIVQWSTKTLNPKDALTLEE
jgi:hypothetical protein